MSSRLCQTGRQALPSTGGDPKPTQTQRARCWRWHHCKSPAGKGCQHCEPARVSRAEDAKRDWAEPGLVGGTPSHIYKVLLAKELHSVADRHRINTSSLPFPFSLSSRRVRVEEGGLPLPHTSPGLPTRSPGKSPYSSSSSLLISPPAAFALSPSSSSSSPPAEFALRVSFPPHLASTPPRGRCVGGPQGHHPQDRDTAAAAGLQRPPGAAVAAAAAAASALRQ
jgi:hypothetical protein